MLVLKSSKILVIEFSRVFQFLLVLVMDGTRCAKGKACKNNKCVSVAEITGPPCPGNCSGHGNCTNKAVCICEEGYFLPDCRKTNQRQITTLSSTTATAIITTRKPTDHATDQTRASNLPTTSKELTPGKQTREQTIGRAPTIPFFQVFIQTIILSLLVCSCTYEKL